MKFFIAVNAVIHFVCQTMESRASQKKKRFICLSSRKFGRALFQKGCNAFAGICTAKGGGHNMGFFIQLAAKRA
jgi:hypothetical protein